MQHEVMSQIRRLANRLATAHDTVPEVRAAALLIESAALMGWEFALGEAIADTTDADEVVRRLSELAEKEGLEVQPPEIEDSAVADGNHLVANKGIPLIDRLAAARAALHGIEVRIRVTERRNHVVKLINDAAESFKQLPNEATARFVAFIGELVLGTTGRRPAGAEVEAAIRAVVGDHAKWPALARLCKSAGLGKVDPEHLRREYARSRHDEERP